MKTSKVNARDAEIGGDGDIEGIAQTISSADIRATLISEAPVTDRLSALRSMKRELEARDNADRGGDLEILIADVDHAIAVLQGTADAADEPTVKAH